jgi:hypothetical protein
VDSAAATSLQGAYRPPSVEDYGTLVELTAAFDPDMLNTVVKSTLTLAQVSAVVPGGEVLPGSESGGTTGAPNLGDTGTGTGTVPTGAGGGGGGGTLGQGAGGGDTGGGGAGGGSGAGDGGAGGKLPFSGYQALLVAGLGAALATAGAKARATLRRTAD